MYNKLVAEQIAVIAKLPARDAIVALNILQSHLRSALSLSNLGELKLLRDPMGSALERDLETVGLVGNLRMRMPRLP